MDEEMKQLEYKQTLNIDEEKKLFQHISFSLPPQINLNLPNPDPVSDSMTSNHFLMMCFGMMCKGSICSRESWIEPSNARKKQALIIDNPEYVNTMST